MSGKELIARGTEMAERLTALEAHCDDMGQLEAADFVEEVGEYVAALVAEATNLAGIVARFSWLALDAKAEETLRLARIGAAFEAELLDMTHTPRFLLSFIVSVRDRAAVAAGVPVEPPEPT